MLHVQYFAHLTERSTLNGLKAVSFLPVKYFTQHTVGSILNKAYS
jgi:hypothetical protein